MQLNALDWVVVIFSLVLTFLPVLFTLRRSGRSSAEFFASGRAAPWWLIGTSMVATTFSTDTPNLVTNFVRTGGVAKNWLWWAFLLTGMTTVFLYASLWRRSGVLTDLEFYELRYSGRSAAFLRGFRALYLGLFFNCFIMATVTLAAVKIANVMLGWDALQTVLVCGLLCVAFGSISGLWGVLTTDLLQFALAMAGVILAAWYALQHPAVGGLHGLVSQLSAAHPDTLAMIPAMQRLDPVSQTWVMNWETLVPLFILPLAVQWWSAWYPGAEPGGGSYIAQRMLAARSERDALAGTLWFNLAHYALRPWPWIIVALASMLVFPTLDDIQRALPHVSPELLGDDLAYPAMLTLLPHGVLGMLVASLLAAYVSTMTTHMNWGASYLVNDFYRRFLSPTASEQTCVWLGRAVSALLMVVSGFIALRLNTAEKSFTLLLSIGAGTGSVYLLRWFWWRVNAWSEISAMIASFACALLFFMLDRRITLGEPLGAWEAPLRSLGLLKPAGGGVVLADHMTLLASVFVTTASWLIVTCLTPAPKRETLVRFYERTRPAGPGWAKVRAAAGLPASSDSFSQGLLGVALGCAVVYSALFGAGNLLYGYTASGAICGVIFLASGMGLVSLLRRMRRGEDQ